MKFILQESKKFILEERFILNEADEKADIKSLKTKSLDLINTNYSDSVFSKLDAAISADNGVEEIEKAGEEVSKAFDNDKKDLTIYRKPIHNYTTLLKKEINGTEGTGAGSIVNAYPDIEDNIQELDDLVETNTTDADEITTIITDLKTKFTALHSAILNAVKAEANVELIKAVKAFKKLRDDLVLTIKNTHASDKKAIEAFEAFIKNLENEAISLADINAAELDDDTYAKEVLAKVNTATTAFSQFNNFLAKYPSSPDGKEADREADGETDWETKFRNATSEEELAKLWNEYYTKEWGNKAQKVADLGVVFQQELLKAGFSEATNPFIPFIKNNIDNLELNAETYPAIHNAYIQEYIDNNDLEATDKSDNILFNDMLYFRGAPEIYEYLNVQHELRTNAKAEIVKLFGGTLEGLLSAVFSDTASIKEIGKQLEDNTIIDRKEDLSKITLRSIGNVKRVASMVGVNTATTDRKTAATDEDVDKIGKKFSWDKNKIGQVLLYLHTKYSNPKLDLKSLALDKINLPSTNLDLSNVSLINTIQDLIKNLDFKNIVKFMLQLADKAHILKDGIEVPA